VGSSAHDSPRARAQCRADGGAASPSARHADSLGPGASDGSDAWRRFCHSNHLEPSMSRKGNCWDNAPSESFFATLKTELCGDRAFATRSEAQAEIFEYIEIFYNRLRLHSTLGYLAPVEFEEAQARKAS
jgi:putative transposase